VAAGHPHAVRVGCSGWNYDDWRGGLYPEGLAKRRWLERYAECFDTVEVNSTFYRLASRDAVARWVEQTAPGFEFSLKASRYLTHMRRLRDVGPGVQHYYERIQPLVEAGQLGPIVWQLPGSFERDDHLLAEVLAARGPALLRAAPPELVHAGGHGAAAPRRRGPGDRRPPRAALPDP